MIIHDWDFCWNIRLLANVRKALRLSFNSLCSSGCLRVGSINVKVKSLSLVWLFATLWTVTQQAPQSMGFSRQEYWSGLPFPSPINVKGDHKILSQQTHQEGKKWDYAPLAFRCLPWILHPNFSQHVRRYTANTERNF